MKLTAQAETEGVSINSLVTAIIAEAVGRIESGARTCECATALAAALITQPQFVPEETKNELAAIIGKYMKT